MKSNTRLVILVGVVALLSLGLHATWSVARADLPQSTATQIYEPSFEEWAFLSLTASYRDYSSQAHFVSVSRQSNAGSVRFKILGRYAKNPAGQDWYDRIGSKIRANIESDCKAWTAEGFRINLNDFEIDIRPMD